MAVYFLDSSALVKGFVTETGSDYVAEVLRSDASIYMRRSRR
ncbi:MAG: hypothetical protein O3A46_05250 [Candidatus Poribacteria bacterium]|nr:hypothetical protein [Candidatus Poribacteria bacterium]